MSTSFKTFSSNLLMESDLDEFSIEKGAAISSPFGVGYMLANINDRVWNVSNDGIEKVLKSPRDNIMAEYASLVEKLNKAKMTTNSVLYIRDGNSTVKLPEGSQKLKTEMTFADFISDWKTSWFAMNDMITNRTGGTLNDQLVPKGGWWGGAFYPFTLSAYINTNHYKSEWAKNWTSIGEKKFWDGLSVPFYQLEGKYPVMESQNYTAVAVELADKGKYAVFVLPKGKLVQFIRGDLAQLIKASDPTVWETKDGQKIQVPALNITLLDQHYKKLETLGINHTFCMPEGEPGPETENKRGPNFMSPIVQAHHVQFSPDFIEVASATGSSVNSEERLKDDHPPDYDYGPAPPVDHDHSAVDAPLGQIATITGMDGQNAEVVVPVVLDDELARTLEEGNMEIKGVDLTIEDPKTNETITAQGSLLSAPPSTDDIAVTAVPPAEDVTEVEAEAGITESSSIPTTTIKIEAKANLPTSTVAPEVVDKDTIQFSQPFFWYLYDKELGPLYYGTVHSLATYRKEYGLETDEDFWLFDAYKTLLWNCP
ncbi:hypothetical protein Ocin01_02729 [Orchesella cincta]|uniref:Serpin domain-containing protein n=1 Tax=Orchesella cincta TaxID=48709 RepID=A0A1D2NFE1_ORCCI|nr:hypothetical protein Ocin01_02729 [Orchesella cincta]